MRGTFWRTSCFLSGVVTSVSSLSGSDVAGEREGGRRRKQEGREGRER